MQSININLQLVMPEVSLKAGSTMICWLVILTKAITHFGNCGKTKFRQNALMLILFRSVANVTTRVLLMFLLITTIIQSVMIVLITTRIFLTSVLRILMIGCLAIGTDDVDRVIRSLNHGKAAGLDGISIEHLIYSHPGLVSHLRKLFNLIMQHGYVPKNW